MPFASDQPIVRKVSPQIGFSHRENIEDDHDNDADAYDDDDDDNDFE